MKRWLLYGTGVIGAIIGLFLVDLYFFNVMVEDPGYYVVARRSDTPRQVLDSLDRLKRESVTEDQLKVLEDRFQIKINSVENSEDRRLWEKALDRTRTLIDDVDRGDTLSAITIFTSPLNVGGTAV